MDPELIRRAGQALYGDEWRGPMVAALGGVSERVLRRWLAGTAPIPAGVWGEVRALVAAERDRLSDILREMEAGQ